MSEDKVRNTSWGHLSVVANGDTPRYCMVYSSSANLTYIFLEFRVVLGGDLGPDLPRCGSRQKN
jgi:hypothetical protein